MTRNSPHQEPDDHGFGGARLFEGRVQALTLERMAEALAPLKAATPQAGLMTLIDRAQARYGGSTYLDRNPEVALPASTWADLRGSFNFTKEGLGLIPAVERRGDELHLLNEVATAVAGFELVTEQSVGDLRAAVERLSKRAQELLPTDLALFHGIKSQLERYNSNCAWNEHAYLTPAEVAFMRATLAAPEPVPELAVPLGRSGFIWRMNKDHQPPRAEPYFDFGRLKGKSLLADEATQPQLLICLNRRPHQSKADEAQRQKLPGERDEESARDHLPLDLEAREQRVAILGKALDFRYKRAIVRAGAERELLTALQEIFPIVTPARRTNSR